MSARARKVSQNLISAGLFLEEGSLLEGEKNNSSFPFNPRGRPTDLSFLDFFCKLTFSTDKNVSIVLSAESRAKRSAGFQVFPRVCNFPRFVYPIRIP